MRADTIVGYTYRADTYCPACIVNVYREHRRSMGRVLDSLDWDAERWLDSHAGDRQIDRYDEATYDSDDFPKVIFADQAYAEDNEDVGVWADRCGNCHKLLLD